MKKLLLLTLIVPTLCSGQTWLKYVTGSGDTVTTPIAKSKGIYDTSATASKYRMDSAIAAIAGKQSTLVSATNIKTVNSGSLLGSGDINTNDSSLFQTKYRSDTARKNIYTAIANKTNLALRINAALGSVVISETLPNGVAGMTSNTGAFVDGRCMFYPFLLEKDATITGAKFYSTTAGNYTADNNNKIGIYTYSAGTLTLVASSTTDGNLWKGTANTWQTKALTSTYAATAGVYFVAFLYNSSAQTTAPVIAGGAQTVTNAFALDFTNSAKWSCYVNTQNDLPASVAMSSLTINSITPYFAIY